MEENGGDEMGPKMTPTHAKSRRENGSMKTQDEIAVRGKKNRSGGPSLGADKRCEPPKCDERTRASSDGLGA